MGKAILVASNFIIDGDNNHINNTIIDGSQATDPNNGSVVTFMNGEDTTSVICGFAITGGTGMIENVYGARIGGGIVCYDASAKIIYNKIINNKINMQGHAWGGGIAGINFTGSKWTVIENNRISQNSCIAESAIASAGGLEIWGNARIINNRIENNLCISNAGIGVACGVLATSTEDDTSLLYFRNNIVQNNVVQATSSAQGGGMIIESSHCIISGNIFNYNAVSSLDVFGGGLLAYQTASLELIDNQISYDSVFLTADNLWYGAGFYCDQPTGEIIIKGNEFSYNSGGSAGWGRGGGIYLGYGSENHISIEGNLFKQNSSFRGGGLYEEGSYNLEMSNNIFIQNSATGGGQGTGAGIVINNVAIISGPLSTKNRENITLIENNTFYANVADEQGGAFRYNGSLSPPVIINCIFWENNALLGKDINNATSEIIVISYSDLDTTAINGPWTGTDNFTGDPLFIDEICHIDLLSPCIDKGIDSLKINGIWYHAPEFDFDGSPRPFGEGFDIGADEWDGDGYEDLLIQSSTFKVQSYPNPTGGDC